MNKNNKKFKNKKLFITRLVTLTSFLVFIAAIITSLSISTNREIVEPGFTKYNSYYDGSNVQIADPDSADAISTITMTRADELGNNNSGKTITIESADELALFSTRCKSTPAFLGYSYKLISNITWSSGYFNTIGTSDNKFTGTFDGQGYQIDDLTMNLADNVNPGGIYYSMFNYVGNGGKVRNFGLSHPVMTVADASDYLTTGGVSYLVGENAGTVDNCFVVDDGDAFSAQAGIYAAGGVARIAGLIVNNTNTGKFRNCYIATSALYNIQLESIAEYNDLCLDNSGTITNCCFYNESIKSFTINGSKAVITYKSAYKLSDQENDYFGTYKEKVDDLVAAFENVSGWYTKNDYGAYKDYTGIKYAIYRGLSLSGTTFEINNEYDFAYMYELFNTDDKFASNELTYIINVDLNLAKIPASSYTYKKGIGSTIKGASNFAGRPLMANNEYSAYPTIYNVDVMSSSRIAVSTGVDCYGLFNYLTGTVENLNVVPNTMNFSSVASSNNAKGIGALSGYIEGGTVKNVNVYLTVSNTNSNIGEYYLGGITGILGGNGKIGHATSAGTFTLNQASTTLQAQSSYMGGVAIGGIVGYIENSNGAVYNTLNSVDINSYLGASAVTYAIGGVIGAGYTMDYDKRIVDGVVVEEMNTGKLENVGTITVGSSSYHSYGELYVAGIIGRHTGELNQVSEMTNKANISVYANDNATYVAGVENADIKSTAVENTKLEASQFVDSEGNKLFYASSLANGANVEVLGSSVSLKYTNVINVIASNSIRSKLSNLYNLAYSYKYDDNGSATRSIVKLSAQNISMPLHNTFAPVLNVVGGTSQNTTKVTTAYNLRDINFNLSNEISSATTFNYTGLALGEYITYEDIKNEGALKVNLTNGISATSTLKLSGLFETLSNGCTARNLYNGGDILIDEPNGSTADKNLNMYLSGICYQNLAVDSSTEQNPFNANFNSNLIGTIDSVINKGALKVESYYLNKTATIDSNPSTKPHYISNIYVGGITYINSGIISNAFNLGNISIDVYSTSVKNYEAGGVTCAMDGKTAQVRDAANNGDIFIVDMGGKNNSIKSIVNIGGIVARNTKTNTNNSQIIAFTINYGTLFGFQAHDNMTTVNVGNTHCSVGGILGIGICNLIDIVNYGNVYGNECVAGIVCIVRLGNFTDTNTPSLANTINYGQVRINPQYYANEYTAVNYQTYNVLLSFEYLESGETQNKHTYAGAISAIFDFTNRNKINVRYLINLYSGATTVLYNLNTPSTAPSVDTFITSHGSVDSFGGNAAPIKYAPLSTDEDEIGNAGAFSSKFIFRRAINKDNTVYDPVTYPTDKYIPEFFQFVAFDKVNQSLLNSIGWQSIAYQSAAEELMKNVKALAQLVDESNAESILTGTFSNHTWLSSINDDLYDSLLEASLETNEISSNITDILEYVLLDSTATSEYTKTIRSKIVSTILEYYNEQGNNDYYTILQSMLYDVLLAKVVSNDDVNYADVRSKIVDIIEDADLSTVFDDYIELLSSSTYVSLLNPLFSTSVGPYYEDNKINLISTLLNGYDDYTLKLIYDSLDTTTSSTTGIKYKMYLQSNVSVAKDIYIHMIHYNSFSANSSYRNFINSYLTKYNFNDLLDEEETIDSSFSAAETDGFPTISSNYGYKYPSLSGVQNTNEDSVSIDSQRKTIQAFEGQNVTSLNLTPEYDYTELWNIIKNDENVQNYISSTYFEQFADPSLPVNKMGIIAIATEMNNTYQSNDRSQLSYNIPITYHGGISVGGRNGRDYYGNGASTNYGDIETQNLAIRTRFIYTPDEVVSYRTNYFGPYIAANGANKKVVYSADGNLTANNANYNIGVPLNMAVSGQSTGNTKRSMVPLFIGIDKDFVSKKIAGKSTSTNSTLYEFYWNNNNDGLNADLNKDIMWKSKSFISNKGNNSTPANNSTGFIYKLLDSSGNARNDIDNYIMYGYDFAPNMEYSKYNDYYLTYRDLNGNLLENIIPGSSGDQNFKSSYVNTTGYRHTYSDYYLTGYATSNIVTGIWVTYSVWTDNGTHISLHSKNETDYAYGNSSGYYGIHTTSFIGYTMDDLLKVDGIRTKGKCNGIIDEDEINILSAICTALLRDNKELVLRAIANYAAENTFTSSNASALNMLISAVKDTSFASEIITTGITNAMNYNYSNSQTIGQYLAALDTSSMSYLDRITAASVDNIHNFRNLLLTMLTDYSGKCKTYANYYDYVRNKVTLFIYDYIKYKYQQDSNLTWSSFDSILAQVSDDDLEKIINMFDVSLDHIYLDDYLFIDNSTNSTYNIYDSTLYNSQYSDYSTKYDSNYDRVLVGNTDYDLDETGSKIVFSTGSWTSGYDLKVTYKGTIYLDNSSTTQTSPSVTTYTFEEISQNSSFVLYFNEDTEIYEFELLNHSGYEEDVEYCEQATSPFAGSITTAQVQSVNFVSNNGDGVDNNGDKISATTLKNLYGNYYINIWKKNSISNWNNYTQSTLSFTIQKGTSITLNSVNISFKTTSIVNSTSSVTCKMKYTVGNDNYEDTITASTYTSRSASINNSTQTLYENTYSYSINATAISNLQNNSNTFTLDIRKDPIGIMDSNSNNSFFAIYDMVITYDFDFVNGISSNKTNCIFNQNLFNNYYSTTYRSNFTLTNANDLCGVDVSGGRTVSYDFSQGGDSPVSGDITYATNAQKMASALIFSPWHFPLKSQGEIYDGELDLNAIDMETPTIVSNLNSGYYTDLSDVGKYVIKDQFVKQGSSSFSTNSVQSFIEFYATGSGTITILNDDSVIDTIAVSTQNGIYKWYEYLTSESYSYEASNGVTIDAVYVAPVGGTVAKTKVGEVDNVVYTLNGVNTVLIDFDYSTIASLDLSNQYLSQFNSDFEVSYDKYQLFYTIYPYYRYVAGKTNTELNNKDIVESLVTLIDTIKFDSSNPTYRTLFSLDEFTDENLIDLIRLVSLADYNGSTSAFAKLIDGLDSQYYISLLSELCKDNTTVGMNLVKYNAIVSIYNYAKAHQSSQLALYIYAAFLGDNYLDNTSLLESTYMYTILSTFNSGSYQFITSNTTVDAEKVTALIRYLSNNSNVNIDGYGIFALSSSQGIGYGIFIPDNLSLSTMDNEYYYDNGDSVYKVGDTDTASWRGGSSINLGAVGTVDYAFYHDMKQLVKSISTDVFELNVTAGSRIEKSVDDQIDNVNKVITYYLTSGLSSFVNATSITINSDYRLANNATLGSTTISLTGSNTTKTAGVSVIVKDAVTVYAEDTGVSSRYTLKFIAIDPSDLSLTADSSDSIPYNGGTITLTLTGQGLLDGMDIEPYLVITSSGTTYSTSGGYWKLDPAYVNNGIVKNGTAKIRIIIDSTLPGGEQAVDVKVTLSSSLVVTYTKVQNTGRDITSFGFVPFGASNQDYSVGQTVPTTINSTIPYGRAYNYEELTDYTSENFYLYKFSISDNAKVVITATKELVENSVSESSAYGGLMKYTVTYTITPETNGAAKTYRHILTESQYFTDGAAYATIYADGNAVTTPESEAAYKALPASERPKYLADGTLTYTYADDLVTIAKFKSNETYYKISYSAKAVTSESFTTDGSLYTLSNGVYNKVTSGTFSSTTAYYERNYAVNNTVTLGNFTTDGSLFTLEAGKYSPVYNGTYSNSITYYSIVYEAASPAITAATFTSNGSLFTRSGEGTQNSPYVYTQVIDKRSLEDDMKASVAFNRTDEYGNSIEPQYRIKYSLSNFYTLGSNVVFGTTESTLGNLATTNITYAGLTVTVSENNDTTAYTFIYTYTNTGIWKDGEVYTRYYEFPEFIVDKRASTDALIHKLTFLEEAIVLGNTATVILPETPLVPDKSGDYYGSDDKVYGTVFNATDRKIVVSSSGVRYTDNTDAVTISDYYAIGTVSDADLSYYCPTFEVNEFAEIYQYTTFKKLTSYGIGKQVETDSEVLSVHDNMYLYVPYEKNNEITILLVEVDESGYWRSVYTTDFAGSQYVNVTNSSYSSSLNYYTRSGDVYSPETVTAANFATLANTGNLYYDCKVGEYPQHTVNNKNAKMDGDIGTTYKVSERAGEEADNSSLYMDYVGTPLDGHFWYVSYVVFSEDYISGGDTRGNVRYYHISIIDATNNVQFEVTVYADTTFSEADIYLTISENTYKKTNDVKNITGKRQISAFADDSSETYTGARASIAGFKIYKLKYDLQTLPGGFFYFYVDLPDGYVAEAYTDKTNNLSNSDVTNLKQNGAFDPATSIITVKIKLEIVIKKGTAQDSSAWAVNTTDIYTRQAEYKGTIPNN